MLIVFIWPALIGGGLSLLGGIMGNRNRSKEAVDNRQFQERMRNTEWQAGVADMEKAGLNPALAYSQGGASSPSGSLANQSDVISPAVTSALAAKRMEEDINLVRANVRKTDAEKDAIRGRPGRIAEPFVDFGVNAANRLFSEQGQSTVRRLGRAYTAPVRGAWNMGRSFTNKLREAIETIREGRGLIGRNVTPRRR